MKSFSRRAYSLPNLFKHYLAAAEAGISYSQYKTAECYYLGRFVERNYEKARFWFEKSAMQGDYSAHACLAGMMMSGLGGEIDLSKAAYHLEKASPICRKSAMTAARVFMDGVGVPIDSKRALRALESHSQGHPSLICEELLFIKIFNRTPPESKREQFLLLIHSELEGNVEATFALGLQYLHRQSSEDSSKRAYSCFSRAAAAGHQKAAVLAASMKIEGKGCPADPKRGFSELSGLWNNFRCHDAAYVRACYYLGRFGFPVDLHAALVWLETPAAEGHPASSHAKAEVLLSLKERNVDTFMEVAELKLKAFESGFGKGLAEMADGFRLSEAPFSLTEPLFYNCLELSAADGKPRAAYELAKFHLTRAESDHDETAGVFWATVAFDEYVPDASVLLADYLLSKYPEQIFYVQQLLCCAAEAGSSQASRMFADMIYKPNSSSNDLAAAYYIRAAELGDLYSRQKIAQMFYYGDGIPIDRSAADYWYQEASNLKRQLSELSLGQSTEEDLDMAPPMNKKQNQEETQNQPLGDKTVIFMSSKTDILETNERLSPKDPSDQGVGSESKDNKDNKDNKNSKESISSDSNKPPFEAEGNDLIEADQTHDEEYREYFKQEKDLSEPDIIETLSQPLESKLKDNRDLKEDSNSIIIMFPRSS